MGNFDETDVVLPSYPIGELIGRIGSGPWFAVGSHLSLIAPMSGELWLAFNDRACCYIDNSGSISASITLQPGLICTPGNIASTTALVAGDVVSCSYAPVSGMAFGGWINPGFTATTSSNPQQFIASLAGTSRLGSIAASYSDAAGVHTITFSYGIAPPPQPTLALPWSQTSGPTTWYNTGGPHYDDGATTPRYALDFVPPTGTASSAWVTAAAAGKVTAASNGLVEIDHGRGFRTGYYHIAQGSIPASVVVGGTVSAGAQLGHPDCNTGWGGTCAGDHLHFYICEQTNLSTPCGPDSGNGMALPITGTVIGGWTVASSPANYNGTLSRPGWATRTADVRLCNASSGCGLEDDIPNPVSAAQLAVSFVPTTTAGEGHSLTVRATDSFGNLIPSYRGTVYFSSSDTQAGLPARYTFTGADNGIHYFMYSVSLKTAGTQWIRATDTLRPSVTGLQNGIVVAPASATRLSVTTASPVSAGSGHSVVVTAVDAYGNRATSYRGSIVFSSSDAKAILPTRYVFTSSDAGIHYFMYALKMYTPGTQWVRSTDAARPSVTGATSVSVT